MNSLKVSSCLRRTTQPQGICTQYRRRLREISPPLLQRRPGSTERTTAHSPTPVLRLPNVRGVTLLQIRRSFRPEDSPIQRELERENTETLRIPMSVYGLRPNCSRLR